VSAFQNIRIFPNHGSRSAVLTWEMSPEAPDGDVYVFFSISGVPGSWAVINPDDPIPAGLGMFQDPALFVDSGLLDGYYKLLLEYDGGDVFSPPVKITGDITRREYGILRGIIHREFTAMRVTNGFPIFHCIPRHHGETSGHVDPDTGKPEGADCGEDTSYGLSYKGGFYPPLLTWLRVIAHSEGLKDDPEQFSPEEVNKTSVRLMAFPTPARGHMLVDPATDKRYLVGDEIKPYRLRGIFPVAFEATIDHLARNDIRYRFPMPEFDTRAYRSLRTWTPTIIFTA
jgi:hypothetical protein